MGKEDSLQAGGRIHRQHPESMVLALNWSLTLSPGSPIWPVGPVVPGGPGRPWN